LTASIENASLERLVASILGLGCLVTAAGAIAGNGNIALALAPAVGASILVAISVAALRRTLVTIIFLGLALDTPRDAGGAWQSPLAPLGRLLIENLNKSVPVEGLRISLLTLLVGYLLLLHCYRQLSGDRSDHVVRWTPALTALAVSLLSLASLCVYGVLTDGDPQMCNLQAQGFVMICLMAFLLAVTLRDPRDYRILGGVIVTAACIKAVMAIWVVHTLASTFDLVQFATSHGDSMLFTSAVAILLVRSTQRWSLSRSLLVTLVLLGMIANNRRLAWVELTVAVITLYAISPWTRAKRLLRRAALCLSPLAIAYVALGWNSNSTLFAPVQLFRSVQDSEANRSTLDRDVENFNLVYTIGQHPVFGTGFGHPYIEAVKGDDISRAFAAYRFVPHNSVLWLWAAGGVVGFLGIWAAPMIGILTATRSYRQPSSPEGKAIAFVVLAILQIYMMQCWGDMGFADPKAIFLVSSALGVASQLNLSPTTATRHSSHVLAA
jgi:O-antigen ligase/polysaccharide polymerase Wzy-like membrane protein